MHTQEGEQNDQWVLPMPRRQGNQSEYAFSAVRMVVNLLKAYHSECQGIERLAVHEEGHVVVLQCRHVTPHCGASENFVWLWWLKLGHWLMRLSSNGWRPKICLEIAA